MTRDGDHGTHPFALVDWHAGDVRTYTGAKLDQSSVNQSNCDDGQDTNSPRCSRHHNNFYSGIGNCIYKLQR